MCQHLLCPFWAPDAMSLDSQMCFKICHPGSCWFTCLQWAPGWNTVPNAKENEARTPCSVPFPPLMWARSLQPLNSSPLCHSDSPEPHACPPQVQGCHCLLTDEYLGPKMYWGQLVRHTSPIQDGKQCYRDLLQRQNMFWIIYELWNIKPLCPQHGSHFVLFCFDLSQETMSILVVF